MQSMIYNSALRRATQQSPYLRCLKGSSVHIAAQVIDYREELSISCSHGNQLLPLPPAPLQNELDRASASSLFCIGELANGAITFSSVTGNMSVQFVKSDHAKLLHNCTMPLCSPTVDQFDEDRALWLAQSNTAFDRPLYMSADVSCSVKHPTGVNNDGERATSLKFKGSASENGEKQRATKEQLQIIKKEFEKYVRTMLQTGVPYRLFNKHVLVEDRFWGRSRTHRGLSALTWTAAKYRLLVKLSYAQTHVEVLRISVFEPLSRITVRWRICAYSYPQWLKRALFNQPTNAPSRKQSTLPTAKVRSTPLSSCHSADTGALWIDGYFELYVNSSGHISRMIIDRVDEDRSAEVMVQNKLITKLLAAIGLRKQELYQALVRT